MGWHPLWGGELRDRAMVCDGIPRARNDRPYVAMRPAACLKITLLSVVLPAQVATTPRMCA
jgi:hypothetical protein